jgi:hypothetical protein
MAATVAATALSTVAAISVDEGEAGGSCVQLAARIRKTVRLKARKARIVNTFLLLVRLRRNPSEGTDSGSLAQIRFTALGCTFYCTSGLQRATRYLDMR